MNRELFRHTEKLYYFYECALLGSFQATSRKLGTTASTLSHAIKKLEKVLGSMLFVRSRNGLAMTQTGRDLHTFCKKFFHELDDIYVAATAQKKQPQRLRLGTFASIAIYFIPILCRELNNDNSVSLSIKTSRSANVLESLLNRDIHLALTVEICKHPNLISHQLYQDKYALYISPDILPSKVSIDWVRQQSLLFMPDASDQKGITLSNHVHSWRYGFRSYFELDSLEVIAEFVRKGLGIGILPTHVASLYRNQLSAVMLPNVPASFGEHRFFLSWRADLAFNHKIIKHVLHLMHKIAEDLSLQSKQPHTSGIAAG